MEQLRLAGVHDDGEHLVVEDETGTRRLLRIDQELRLAVQRARRLPAARQRGGQFGPREIQARFRAGATVDEIVAESGWEAARVRRYEWPILAERAHVAAEAQKVEIEDPTAHRGYHSVFEGEPLTLGRAVAHRAGELGVDPASLEWDSWQREDQLWTVVARFVVVDPAAAPGEEPSPAEWIFNPANQSVRSANAWAEALTEPERPDTPITAGGGVVPGGLGPELTQLRRSAVEADDLLDVLQARRGQRLGEDVQGDDALAELLGRGMGHLEHRPRPLGAPEDTPVFDRPFQAATQFPVPAGPGGTVPEPAAAPAEEPVEELVGEPVGEPAAPERAPEPAAPVGDRTAELAGDRGEAPAAGAEPAGDEGPASSAGTDDAGSTAEPASADRPRPRNRTAKARRSNRSSVPSWDEIVFGSSSD
ncbi:MAG TPA: septation protein SepH [Kocuria rosea]|nr:septation protein SepH [Kocuria rosea]